MFYQFTESMNNYYIDKMGLNLKLDLLIKSVFIITNDFKHLEAKCLKHQ